MELGEWLPPFVSKPKIAEIAESFRSRHCGRFTFPLPIDLVTEKELQLDLIPVSGIRALARISAFLRSDFSGIVVDLNEFQDERFEPRLRFSIAHEVGHFVMHQDLYRQFKVHSVEDYVNLIQNIREEAYRAIEFQANWFAGTLLVPRDALVKVLTAAQKDAGNQMPPGFRSDTELLREWVTPSVARTFGVTEGVIDRRIRDEGLT
jgi:Zn-dependent peptidase ImmA (M78 family)